ncbi:Bug family tripartite tricarboxylate transporter substrate binding protein [Plastoroseomonas arctica]|uniref:Tripartite tricarboxylate transporter substrate binding protein n=1 Tax=Plastoroseomonas arctica TaxID=1509237 RepID=A0AAF1KNF9_9PROT|nr:tripartite tricarboxylate transporter substrate binding protein [Plastoroseomonas arctica]MBR0657551.1 tripartite tricarboxylate transporter substrate binding protein [Plastoroseomonas arctica]
MRTDMTIPWRRLFLAAALGLCATLPAAAQWPDRPIRILVAFPPGASTDVLVRALAQALTPALGQPVIVENRPGAGGNIATVAVRRATPDGYTLLAHSVAYAVNPSLYRSAGYDAVDDLAPVAMLANTPNVITVNPALMPVQSLAALLDAGRRAPFNYASSGTGTTTHLGMELLLRSLAHVDAQHVPFGPAQAVTAVVAGQAPVASTSLPPALPMIRDGRIRALAVTSAARDPALPEVPTVAEQGFTGFEALTWFALFAPKDTPAPVAERLNAAIDAALATPALRERLDSMGFAAAPMTRAAFAAYLRAEVAKWAEVVRTSGSTVD